MNLVSSLLQAMVSVDGEALVMHAGEKPYVIGPAGQVDLARGGLTLQAVSQIVNDLLPAEFQQALEEFGVAQYSLPQQSDFPREQFTVIAARGGDDVWAEVRRRRVTDDEQIPEDFYTQPLAAPAVSSEPPIGIVRDAATPIAEPTELRESASPTAPTLPPEAPVDVEPPRPAVVLPLARNPIRAESAPSQPPPDDVRPMLARILRTAAVRGASAVYLASGTRPSIRADGDLQMLDGESELTPNQVVSLLMALMPERSHEALRTGAATEWISDVEDIGRVRCMSFSDHRGPGGVLRLMAPVMSAEQLGLAREIQALAQEPDGLVLVSGPRSSGKRMLVSGLVDVVNRTRRAHVISIEREIAIAHGPGLSFISQREVRGSDEHVLAEARSALREDPDVLILDQIHTRAVMELALEAAALGHLVIGGMAAQNASDTIDRAINLFGNEHGRSIQQSFAASLKGVVVQVLLQKSGGGRIAAREVLLKTPTVAGIIAEGRTSQLPMAIESGRHLGMVAFADVLLAYVRNGSIDVAEACRHVVDREAFRALLEGQGLDHSQVERRA